MSSNVIETTGYPRLCGGTFFSLLVEACKQHTSAREKLGGARDGLSDREILLALIRVVSPAYVGPDATALDAFRTQTSQFKNCSRSNFAYIPFGKAYFSKELWDNLTYGYEDILQRMTEFLEKYVFDAPIAAGAAADVRSTLLVKSLILLIREDDEIAEYEHFRVIRPGQAGTEYITKNLLYSDGALNLELQPFLLSVLYYILVKCRDNRIGAENKERLDTLGAEITRDSLFDNITVTLSAQPPNQRHVMEALPTTDYTSTESYDRTDPVAADSDDACRKYLKKARAKFEKVKTILYSDEPHLFTDIYVCNRLEGYQYDSGIALMDYDASSDVTVDQIVRTSAPQTRCIILTGTCGIGKSMMLQHLMLDALTSYDQTGQLPFFVPLSQYRSGHNSLFDFICECIHPLCDNTELFLEDALQSGQAVLLLNGLDEVGAKHLMNFQKQLVDFNDQYPDCTIIMSSRPCSDFSSYVPFSAIRILPFTKAQAIEMIHRLNFRSDAPSIKESFIEQLENHLFTSYHDFAQNPLLLTIMLMTYEQYAETPSKMRIFFSEVYSVLSQKHDASKGAYERHFRTGLSVDRLSEYLAGFCARTWYAGNFNFTKETFKQEFDSLQLVKETLDKHSRHYGENVDAMDFLYDLENNICILLREGEEYHFIHRSFQGYFCALGSFMLKDSQLTLFADFFNNSVSSAPANAADNVSNNGQWSRSEIIDVFDMMYDMNSKRVEECFFLPELDRYFMNEAKRAPSDDMLVLPFILRYILYRKFDILLDPEDNHYQPDAEELELLRSYKDALTKKQETARKSKIFVNLF